MSRTGRQIDFSRENRPRHNPRRRVLIFHTSLITDLVLDCYSVSLVIFSIPSPWRISPIIQFPLGDLDPTLVDHLNLYLSACPIRHSLWPSVSCGSQDSIIQESSPQKCGQKVSCRNAVIVAFLLYILGHLPVLYSHSTYPYQQSAPRTFSRTVDHLYGPRPWLAKDSLILDTIPYVVMTKTDFSVC